jgi:predicted acylesterase/phospholipase RssA
VLRSARSRTSDRSTFNTESLAMQIGLALSGGGFRASLFHLGVIRRLAAEGRLAEIGQIASVSGGSITAAHLLANWEKYNSSREDFDRISAELISLTKIDLRGRIQRRLPFLWLLALIPFLPNRSTLTPTHLLAKYYDRYLYHGVLAADVAGPDRPVLLILSTNLSLPGLSCFGPQSLLNIPFDQSKLPQIPTELNPLAQIVAASSAYPAFFPPMSLNHSDVGAPEGALGKQEYFTDAGIFDNLGLYGLKMGSSDSLERIYASDAGRSFVPQKETEFGILRTALRTVDILMFRIRQLDLAASATGPSATLISISHDSNAAGASSSAIQSQLENVRTDLDKFSQLEIGEVIRHGYYVAASVLASEQGHSAPVAIPGWDIPTTAGKDTQRAFARELQTSSKRRWRLFSLRDWVSWAQLAMVALALVVLVQVSGRIVDQFNSVVAGIQAYRLTNIDPPEWTEPPPLVVETVKELTQPTNEGFEILGDDRVWDLRRLQGKHLSARGIQVVGPTLLKRVSTLIKREEKADQYRYLYLTSATKFFAWSTSDKYGVKLLRSVPSTTSGTNVVTSYELQFDVSRVKVGEEFVLSAQAKTIDALWDRNNTWVGMRITDATPAASMRIIVPKDLPYKRPVFLSYPNDSALPAPSTDGIVLDRAEQKELIWRVDHPEPGWTYRVQWDWE